MEPNSVNLIQKNLKEIPNEILENPHPNVSSFTIQCNQLTKIPGNLFLQYQNLTEIDFWNNYITSLPPEIGLLSSLVYVKFTINRLNGLPDEFGRLSCLETVHLGSNCISQLPSTFSQLTNLKRLYLTENCLTCFPTVLLGLNLEVLDLSYNPIGSIPPDIGQMTSLIELNIAVTGLKVLPDEIVLLSNLMKLDLRINSLSVLPPNFDKLSLKTLMISFNDFEIFPEKVPPTLCHLHIGGNKNNFYEKMKKEERFKIITSAVTPDKILPYLWLGSLESAKHKNFLKSENITHILAIMNDYKPFYPGEFVYKCIEVEDMETEDIQAHFQDAINFISNAIESGGKALVHCAAGVSRSASIVIAYIMYTKRLSFCSAFKLVKDKRECIFPNLGFQNQLKSYQKKLEELRKSKNEDNCVVS